MHVSPYEEHTDTLAFSLLIFNSAIHSKSSLKFFVFLFKAFFPSIVYHRLTRLPRDNVLALIAILLPLFLFLSSFRSTFFICKCSSPPVLCLAEIMRRRARAGRHAALRGAPSGREMARANCVSREGRDRTRPPPRALGRCFGRPVVGLGIHNTAGVVVI